MTVSRDAHCALLCAVLQKTPRKKFQWTVPELKQLCKEHGIPTKGVKQQLMDRLTEHGIGIDLFTTIALLLAASSCSHGAWLFSAPTAASSL